MRQTTLSIPLEVEPDNVDQLAELIKKLREEQEAAPAGHGIYRAIPTLHFMSLSIFDSAEFDPLFVIEVNFDEPAAEFWQAFECALEPQFREMIRCCKEPLNTDRQLYRNVVAGWNPVTSYLEARALRPSAYHHGNRGLSRERIIREGALFGAVQAELEKPVYRNKKTAEIHHELRKSLEERLNSREPARRGFIEFALDALHLIGLLLLIVFGLSVPGIVLALILPAEPFFVLSRISGFVMQPSFPRWALGTGIVYFIIYGVVRSQLRTSKLRLDIVRLIGLLLLAIGALSLPGIIAEMILPQYPSFPLLVTGIIVTYVIVFVYWIRQKRRAPTGESELPLRIVRVLGLLPLLIFGLSVPGIIYAACAPIFRKEPSFLLRWTSDLLMEPFFVLLAISITVIGFILYRIEFPRENDDRSLYDSLRSKIDRLSSSRRNPLLWLTLLVLLLALYLAVATGIGAGLDYLVTGRFAEIWRPTFRAAGYGVIWAFVVSIPFFALWLRWLERHDTSHDAPPVDPELMKKMAGSEDHFVQNHMGSIVIVKPGILRMALFRVGHLTLSLTLRLIAADGFLGGMRTVHFGHWAFVSNQSRLLFLSNFDHSWDSYLDDFIEKAHGGLTLAWGSALGFPPARFLILEGATHGRKFKNWARHSMTENLFWFSAYPDYTVDQIERHYRIANGLRRKRLRKTRAAKWAMDL